MHYAACDVSPRVLHTLDDCFLLLSSGVVWKKRNLFRASGLGALHEEFTTFLPRDLIDLFARLINLFNTFAATDASGVSVEFIPNLS